MTTGARAFLIAFVVDSVIHLTAIATEMNTLANITKPILMICLMGVTLTTVKLSENKAVKFLLLAQFFSLVGDVFLIGDGIFFILGMAGFAVAQINYMLGYFRLGARQGYAQRKWVLVVFPLFWVIANAALWSGLGAMRIPILIYSILLVGMAMTSMTLGTLFGIGGSLFMISDLLIGEGIAYGDFPGSHFLIMLTYIVGQVIICFSFLNRVKAQNEQEASDSFASVSSGAKVQPN